MSGGCIHQARKCPVCERDAEVARLRAAMEHAEMEPDRCRLLRDLAYNAGYLTGRRFAWGVATAVARAVAAKLGELTAADEKKIIAAAFAAADQLEAPEPTGEEPK